MNVRIAAPLAGGVVVLVGAGCGGGHHDKAPVPVIVSPHDGQSFLPGDVQFEGRGTDPEDGVLPSTALRWEIHDASNVVAGAFQGATGSLPFNTKGDYTVVLFAKDSSGKEGRVTVPMHVADTIAVLTNPDNQALLASATPFNLNGHAETQAMGAQISSMEFIGTDESDGSQIFDSPVAQAAMNCNGTFTICDARVTPSVPSGRIKLHLAVTTTVATETAEDTLHVVAGQAPQVTISAPLDGSQVAPGTQISFSATVTSPNGGQVASTWQDSVDGALGSQLQFTHGYADPAKHVVTLTAVDSLGFSASASVTLYIQAPGNPLFADVASLPDTSIRSLAREDNGGSPDTIWVGGSAHVTSVASDTGTKGATDYATSGAKAAAASYVSSSGERLFGLLGSNIDVLSAGASPAMSNYTQMQDQNVHAIVQLPSAGDLVFGTDNGIEVVDVAHAGATTVYANGILGGVVYALAVDASGIVYAGTDAGLVRVDGLPGAANTTPIGGIASDVVLSLALDGVDLWIGTDNGLSRLNTMSGEITTWTDPLPSRTVPGLAVDSSGIVWIGTGSGAARFDAAHDLWTYLTGTGTSPDLAGRFVNAVLVDKAGAKWFACSAQGGGGGGGGTGGLTRYVGK